MPQLSKRKLSALSVAANLMDFDRLVLLRRAQDEPDASKRNQTVGRAALQAWLGITFGAQRLTLTEAQAIEGGSVAERGYLITGTPDAPGATAGTWNGNGKSEQVYVTGYENWFGTEGVLLNSDARPVARVLVNVGAGTYRLAAAPSSQPGGPFPVIFLTHADAVAAGRSGDESLDQIDPELLVLGSHARVDRHPDGSGVELVLAYDPQGPLLARLSGNLAGERTVKVSWQRVVGGVVSLTVAQLQALPAYAPGQQYLVTDAPAAVGSSIQSPSDDTSTLLLVAQSAALLAPFGLLSGRTSANEDSLVQVYGSGGDLSLLVLPPPGRGVYTGAFQPNMAYGGGLLASYQGGLYASKQSFTSGANFNAADWDKLADGSGAPATLRDIYDVPQAVRDAVTASGSTYTNGELQGSQPSGSLAGMKLTTTSYGYEYQRGAAGSLVWCRYPKG